MRSSFSPSLVGEPSLFSFSFFLVIIVTIIFGLAKRGSSMNEAGDAGTAFVVVALGARTTISLLAPLDIRPARAAQKRPPS